MPQGTDFNSPNRVALAFSAANPAGPYVAAGILPPGVGLAHWNGSSWMRGTSTPPRGDQFYSPLVDLAFSDDGVYGFTSSAGFLGPTIVQPEVLPFTVNGRAEPFASILPSQLFSMGVEVADVAVAVDTGKNPVVAVVTGGSAPTLLVYEYTGQGEYGDWAGDPQPARPDGSRVGRSVDVQVDAATGQLWVAASFQIFDPYDAVYLYTWTTGARWKATTVGLAVNSPLTHASLVLGPGNTGAPNVAFCQFQGTTLREALVAVATFDPTTSVVTYLDDLSIGGCGC